MSKIAKIKKELKIIQCNFNPQKSTYKIIDDLINNNYSVNEMISNLSKIKGVNKYPVDLKQSFIKIINDLKEIEAYELEEKIKEKKELEQKEQEAKTKELKDLINALEMRKDNKQKNIILPENKKESLNETSTNYLILDEEKELEKIQMEESNLDDVLNETEKKEFSSGSKIFKILLFLVIITFIIAVGIFFLY